VTGGLCGAAVVRLVDPALPGSDRLADRRALARLLDGLAWLPRPDLTHAAIRVRWKPGTNLRVGVVVGTDEGPRAVLATLFTTDAAGKARGLAERADRAGLPAHHDGPLVVVPAAADPALHADVPHGRVLSYNPARRWVGRVGDDVVKVHAQPLPAAVAALLTGGGPARHLPACAVERAGRIVRTAWVPGRPPQRGDLPAVDEAVAALHATPAPAALPVLAPAALVRAAVRAAGAVTAVLPAENDRLAALVHALRAGAGTCPAPRGLVHGDLSPDQVVVDGRRALLLDLDRAAVGPTGWDAAQWTVAQLAAGGPVLPAPGPAAPPVLVLAAALMRAPEPLRRLHPAWPACTEAVLRAAEVAAAELELTP